MIGSIGGPLRGGEQNALDAPVAALAGLSVAFLAFAAPPETVDAVVEASGLSALIPAAEPPLGARARFLIGAAAAIAVFAVAFGFLRSLDRVGRRRPAPKLAENEVQVPRLRRRDLHPDAPPRPPLMAALELSEPADREAEPTVWFEPQPGESEAVGDADCVILPEVAIVAKPEQSDEPDPIPQLMERLEAGLARRRSAAEPVQVADPLQVEEGVAEDRLQSAIESLQRLASRQS